MYWKGVRGFRGCYLTTHNNGEYGVSAYDSFDGRIEHSYASANADAGFYLGHRNPFYAVITDVLAKGNGLGYSGTGAGGDLTMENSTWRNNWAGIVPNTRHPDDPQRSSKIVNNVVYNNNNTDAPALVYSSRPSERGFCSSGAATTTSSTTRSVIMRTSASQSSRSLRPRQLQAATSCMGTRWQTLPKTWTA